MRLVECDGCGCVFPPSVTRGVCPECDFGVAEPRKMKDLEE